jgi:sulfide:quinone oxidoreductase
MLPSVLILGAGFGGLELASRLSARFGEQAQITLIDKNDSFVFGFTKLDVMVGSRRADDVRAYYRDIVKPGVDFRQETVVSIDAGTRRVVTDTAAYEPDILVIALGADLDPSATPGFVEGGHEFYTPEGAARVAEVLPSITSGTVVVAVLGGFFKCPPAPNEAVILLHDYFVRRGVRDDIDIRLLTPMPMPIPISQETSQAIVALLEERGIRHAHKTWVTSIDPAAKIVHLRDDGMVPYDLFLGVPVHRAPQVVVDAGLTEADGWIAVDLATFATRFPGIYAVGDVASAPVPRAGIIAEGEAGILADVIVAQVTDGALPPAYDGGAVCYIEMGNGEVARVDVNFLAGDAPTALFKSPSTAYAAEKHEFAMSRLQRWFGYANGWPGR